MDQETQHLFSRQLAHWAEQIISEGRSPFRKVDLELPLLTRSGEIRPPLLFWINRESFMAGGTILFSGNNPEATLEQGRNCAEALGLRHFVVWGPREIYFQEVREHTSSPVKTLCLATTDEVGFQQALNQVMEELKVLSVLGTLPPEQLSPYYLVNLWCSALAFSFDTLFQEYRADHGEGLLKSAESAVLSAHDKSTLTLLRLLTLIFLDRLAVSVQPENLEVAMFFILETFAGEIRRALQKKDGEPELPSAVAIRFHHLFRRLSQLELRQDPQRTGQALEILIDSKLRPQCNEVLLNAESVPDEGPSLLLQPFRPALCRGTAAVIEFGSPPLLAALALLRLINKQAPAQTQTDDLFSLSEPFKLVQGTLDHRAVPDRRQRQTYSAHLRRSWPTRRFVLDARTPCWAWELFHLLGLAAARARFELNLPIEALTSRYSQPLLALLKEEFTLNRLVWVAPEQLRMVLTKDLRPEQLTSFARSGETRLLPWAALRNAHHALLALALFTETPIFALIESGSLNLPQTETWPKDKEREIFLFSQSSLGRYLWQIVGNRQPLPSRKNLAERGLAQGLPLPGPTMLNKLQQIPWHPDQPLPPGETLDNAVGLHLDFERPQSPFFSNAPASKRRFRNEQPTAELFAEIIQEVFADGIPRFPEHYLYAHYRPQLTRYAFSPPLTVGGEFFDQFTLVDTIGETFTVEGRETAQALLLAAALDCPETELPADRELTALIVGQYLNDLRRLHRSLKRLTHMRIVNSETAAQVTAQIWDEQNLPPWTLVKSLCGLSY